MQKRKNSDGKNNNQLLLLGLGALILLGGTGILGALVDLVLGVIGIAIGLVGAVIGIVFGLIGAVIGIVGAILGTVLGTAIFWIPIVFIVLAVKAMSKPNTSGKKKRTTIS